VLIAIGILIGLAAGATVGVLVLRVAGGAKLNGEARHQRVLLEQAKREAEAIKREAEIEARAERKEAEVMEV